MANERNILNPLKILKASFSFSQIIPQITQTHTLYTSLYHFISFLPYFIILDNNNSVKLSNKMSSLETVDLGRGRDFSCKNMPDGPTGTNKSSFSKYKQVSIRNGDHE